MKGKRFIALGDIIADFYYDGNKLLMFDGGSSRFNVIANLANMKCKTAVIGGCGGDSVGKTIVKRLSDLGIDTSSIFFRDCATRRFNLMINKENKNSISYNCTKYSPEDGQATWYNDDAKDLPYFLNRVKSDDIIILDNLDEFSREIINKVNCEKIMDIGNTKQLSIMSDEEISKLQNKFEILQLNENVIPFLQEKLNCKDVLEIYKFFSPKLMIVTHGKKGADFVFDDKIYSETIEHFAPELDPTGAGDSFLSSIVKDYYDNSKNLDADFVHQSFNRALALTSEVVQHFGARGHIYEKSLTKRKRSDGDPGNNPPGMN